MVVKGSGHGGPTFITPEYRQLIEDFFARHLGKRPVPKGQRVFTCGHSFHWFVYPLLAEMAKSRHPRPPGRGPLVDRRLAHHATLGRAGGE